MKESQSDENNSELDQHQTTAKTGSLCAPQMMVGCTVSPALNTTTPGSQRER
jgi:hypothetical protein